MNKSTKPFEMTVQNYLDTAIETLYEAGVATSRLDALVLLEDALGVDRAKLLAYPDMEITQETQNVLNEQLARRAEHEPLAYIRGKTEFYGRDFLVTNAVLEPRPESETMIELLKTFVAEYSAPQPKASERNAEDTGEHVWRIADVGTGSGALGITATLELPEAVVDLLEVDESALEVAHSNVIKFTSGNLVFKTDLLEKSSKNYDILLCNLPYVPDEHTINAAALHEPALAIFGGPDGLDLYRRLFAQVDNLNQRPLLILCESLPPQHNALKALAEQHHYIEHVEDDFIQAFTLAA